MDIDNLQDKPKEGVTVSEQLRKLPMGYAFIDTRNGNVDCIMGWDDGRDLPKEVKEQAQSYHKIVSIEGFDTLYDGEKYFNMCYNSEISKFMESYKVTCDKNKIKSSGETAILNIQYPTKVNETNHVSIDGQSVDIKIVNGKATIPFISKVIGFHNIIFESSSFYGKNLVYIEVVK